MSSLGVRTCRRAAIIVGAAAFLAAGGAVQGALAMTLAQGQAPASASVSVTVSAPASGPAGKNRPQATLRCQAAPDGGLHDCALVSETPKRMGYGNRALALVAQHHFRAVLPGGAPTPASSVTVSINFDPPPLQPSTPTFVPFSPYATGALDGNPQWRWTSSRIGEEGRPGGYW